ncbi:gliding motility protein GldN [Abyssalbus ytuae]|uniref:Gliding motility protein GldN n=1 Tax=Abyssalbus ytuae TaxID=2926907 RepID=A0A9E6ZVS6_9FLAO|nr:gliding motility protein GldN [Abyssalbus ytuae]UOB18688.1 gliding motility protein GldN [Abyssalbus ytuae]
MNWKGFLLTAIGIILFSSTGYSQANILSAKTPEEIGVKTPQQIEADHDSPLPYGYVGDRDILWSKTVWERLDLDERINFPFYYPVDTVGIGADRRSLYDVLLRAVKTGKIKEVYSDSYFTEKRTLNDLQATLRKVDTTDLGYEQLNAGEQVSPEYVNIRDLTAADIEEWHIKGIWYFDKRQGELKYRLLGLAPVAPDVNFIDSETQDLVELFWVWFPGARDILHDAMVFNHKNTASPISYDQLLNARRFNAHIYKVDNVYGDREIVDYIPENALFQLLEAQRLKEVLRDKEQDMWSY